MIAKWLVVGRIRAVEHPLWSSFVWRNEVSDTFVETVAAPWFARAASGTPVMNLWLRGARRQDRPRRLVRDVLAARGRPGHAGRRLPPSTAAAWCRPTCSTTGSCGWTPSCSRRVRRWARIAWRCPPRGLGAGATVGPASLVMRGDEVPASTRWQGNPIAPWNLFRKKRADAPPDNDARGNRRVTRSKKAAKKVPVIDPYLPHNGNFGYRVSRYELELEYKVAINRLAGTATITAVTLAALRTFTLDLSDALSVTKVSVNGRRPASFSCSGGKLHIALSSSLPAGAAMTIEVRYGGTPRPIRSFWGEVGFEELTERGAGRGPAQRRRVVVPVRRPSERQGQLPDPDQHREPVSGNRQRRVDVSADPRGHDDVDLRAGRADVDVSGHAADRRCTSAYRLQKAPRADAGGAAAAAEAQLRSRLRPPAADDEAVRQAVRAVSAVDRLHRRGHRRRPGDPLEAQGISIFGANHCDGQRRLRAADRARAGAPVVRQQRDGAALARHLAARGLRLLRRVAVVGGVRRPERRRVGPPLPPAAASIRRRICCSPTRDRATCSTTGSTSAAR